MEVLRNMVEVRQAHKSYGACRVLSGLHMDVPTGTIYGLLGPSGCGKSTLLGCLVGQKQLDAGLIRLAVTKRKHIGFMPQNTALFEEFTVEEIFYFYGRVFGLCSSTIDLRIKQYTKLLDLPQKSRIIKTLSGGQRRRTSLGVSLVHDPSLVILDEPTVGLDPVLCYNVWQFLVQLANVEGKTIIITTHYIEEARQSNVIGLMREGVLLVQESPNQLMTTHNATSLEEVFLHLSKKQQCSNLSSCRVDRREDCYKMRKNESPLTSEGLFKFNRFSAQLIKNVRSTCRNIPMVAFLLLLPVIQGALFSTAFGKEPQGLTMGLVSDELSSLDLCPGLAANLTYSPTLQCAVPLSFTCQYLEHLRNRTNIVMYKDVGAAKLGVSKNDIWGVLYIKENFTRAFVERISDGLQTDDFTIDQSIISVWLDMTDFIIAQRLTTYITESLVDFAQDVLKICGINPDLGTPPIQVNEAIYGEFSSEGFRHTARPGFILSFVFYMPMLFTSGSVMLEKKSGYLDRSMIAGLSNFEIICAHLLVQIVVATAQTSIFMVVCYVVFPYQLAGDMGVTVALLYAVIFLGIACGYFLAEWLTEEKSVAYAGVGIILTMFLVSGIVWPQEGIHPVVAWWAKGFPVVAAVDSYQGITMRGWGLAHPAVYTGFLSCLGWTVFFLLATTLTVRFGSN